MTEVDETKSTNRIKQLLFTLGKAYLDRHQYAEAYEKLSQLVDEEPENPEVTLHAAIAAIGLNKTSEKALKLYKQAISQNPDLKHLVISLGELFSRCHITSPFAIEICEKSLELSPNDKAQIHTFLKNYYYSSGLTNKARIEEQKAIASQDFETIQSYLESLWWNCDFSTAFEILNKAERRNHLDKNYNQALALTHVYLHLSKEESVKDEKTIKTIFTALDSLSIADSVNDLRNYLTLQLSLPHKLNIQQKIDSQFQDYKFNLKTDLLETLNTTAHAQQDNENLHCNWKSFLFTQLHAQPQKRISEQIIDLVGSHLSQTSKSVVRNAGTGFMSLTTDANLQIKAVTRLLQSLEKYNKAVTTTECFKLYCGIVVSPKNTNQNVSTILTSLVKAAHLLRFAELHFEENGSAGVLLLNADEEALKKIKKDGTSLTSLNEIDLIPGLPTVCTKVIWRNPLSDISKDRAYKIRDIEIRESLRQHNGFATYLGTDKRLGRRVILKAMFSQQSIKYLQNQIELENLYEKIRTIGRMNHQNIATLFDMGEQDHILYFVREYIEGKIITEVEFLNDGWETEFVSILIKILDALIYAQQYGVAHLNLKPGNIWINDSHDVKITDFHLPGFVDNFSSSNNTLFAANRKYFAPEILSGARGDCRSDIYSIGVIAHELITNQHTHLKDTKQPHRKMWDQVVVKAMKSERGERFSSLNDLKRELETLQKESKDMAESNEKK